MRGAGPGNRDGLVDQLTRRETEVLRLICEGASNKEIALRLSISINSVRWFAAQIYSKLNVKNRRQAADIARQSGIVPAAQANTPAAAEIPTGNLPAALNAFIGRADELNSLGNTLTQPATRLLSLTGTGGVGKSRLALELARRVQAHFADGVWLVELAPLSDPDGIPHMVAKALGLMNFGQVELPNLLKSYLHSRHLLLILDNVEHLLDPCAALVEVWLKHCAKITVMITSRQALHIPGEIRFRVPPLPAPDPQEISMPAALQQGEAVQLFASRATAVDPDFELAGDTLFAVSLLCHRLDGIPLAIELAAARVDTFRADQLLARLDDRFNLLTGGSRTALPRHRVLLASIEWSYHLLSWQERTLIQRLTVFSGGWSLEAAEAVCGFGQLESGQVENLLAALVDKSLVVCDPKNARIPFYWLLETIRQFCLLRLAETGDEQTLRGRHLSYYRDYCEVTYPKLHSKERNSQLQRLADVQDNLKAALDWALTSPPASDHQVRTEDGLRLAVTLFDHWNTHGLGQQGQNWLRKGLELLTVDSLPRTFLRASALLTLYKLTSNWSGFVHQEYLDESILLFREVSAWEPLSEALALKISYYTIFTIDYEKARPFAEESLAIALHTKDAWTIAFALHCNSVFLAKNGDLRAAQVYALESEYYCVSSGNHWWTWIYRFFEGYRIPEPHNPEEKRAYFRTALNICQENHDLENEVLVLFIIADEAYVEKDYARMQREFQDCLDRSRAYGMTQRVCWGLRHTGTAWKYLGDLRHAASLFFEALQLSQEHDFKGEILVSIEQIAGLAVILGQPERATRLLGLFLKRNMAPLSPYYIDGGEYLTDFMAARRKLGNVIFDQAFAAGLEMTLTEGIVEAAALAREILHSSAAGGKITYFAAQAK